MSVNDQDMYIFFQDNKSIFPPNFSNKKDELCLLLQYHPVFAPKMIVQV